MDHNCKNISPLDPNEIETLRRWANDPSLFTPTLTSHLELLRRAVDSIPPIPKLDDKVILSQVESSYPPSEKVQVYAETMEFSPDIHAEAGLYLQFVDGCGYDTFRLTPSEAEELAGLLMASAKKAREAFKATK